MSSLPVPRECPSGDGFSALVDGTGDDELQVHLESCAGCRRAVEGLRRVDGLIRRRMAPPPGLAGRVVAAVKASEASGRGVSAGWRVWPALRFAAVLAVTAAALAAVVQMLNRAGSDPGRAGGAPSAGEQTVAGAGGSGAAPGDGAVTWPAAGDGTEPGAPSGLPGRVQHVWAVANAEGECKYLVSLLPQGSYEMTRREDGNTVFNVLLTDRQLQSLVDRLHEHEWQLVSPNPPQPRQRVNVALRGQPVHYTLVLLNSGGGR